MALFPPNSKSDRPKRPATAFATALPIRVLPVALTRGTMGSLLNISPTSAMPFTTQESAAGTSLASATSFQMCWQAMEQSALFSEGFHTQESPQTQASAVFQAHTATGKLKAEMIPTTPIGWYCSYMR